MAMWASLSRDDVSGSLLADSVPRRSIEEMTMAQVNPRYPDYADALIARLERCGVRVTDHSRRLVRATVVDWLEEFPRVPAARKHASRTQASAFVPGLMAETSRNVLKSERQSFLRWIVQWTFTVGFKLVGLFVLWTLPLYFDKEPPVGVKK